MEDFRSEDRVGIEAGVSASEAGEALAEALEANRLADRLQHINAHRADTHDSPNARTVVLRQVSADLMEIEACVAEALHDAVAATPMTVENMNEYFTSIDFVIRLAKQVGQATQLEMRSSQREG
jgi:hypothetical protein